MQSYICLEKWLLIADKRLTLHDELYLDRVLTTLLGSITSDKEKKVEMSMKGYNHGTKLSQGTR